MSSSRAGELPFPTEVVNAAAGYSGANMRRSWVPGAVDRTVAALESTTDLLLLPIESGRPQIRLILHKSVSTRLESVFPLRVVSTCGGDLLRAHQVCVWQRFSRTSKLAMQLILAMLLYCPKWPGKPDGYHYNDSGRRRKVIEGFAF